MNWTISINPSLLELLHLLLLLEHRHTFPLQPFRNFLPKALDARIEKEQVIEALLEELGDIVDSLLLIKVVQHDYLVFFVLVGVELRDELVCLYAHTWEVQSLSDVVLLVLLGLSQVDKQKICLNTDWKLFSANGDGC